MYHAQGTNGGGISAKFLPRGRSTLSNEWRRSPAPSITTAREGFGALLR